MRRIAKAFCAAALLAVLAPGTASAAFGPVTNFGSATLSHPQGAVVGGSQLYVADTGNGRIVPFAGAAPQTPLTASGFVPTDVAVASDGTVYAAGQGGVRGGWALPNVPLFSWTPPGSSYGIAVGGSAVYVSDTDGGVIRKYNGVGAPDATTPSFGSKGTGTGQLLSPRGLTADSAGSVYVADPGNGKVVKFSPTGQLQQEIPMPSYTIVSGSSTINGRIDPRDVAVDGSGRIVVPDAGTSSNLVAVFGSNGSLQQLFGSPVSDASNPCHLSGPWGVAVSGASLYVVSTGENRIRVFSDPAGSACPTPNFGSAGGVTPPGGGGVGGGSGGTAGVVSDRARPTVNFLGFPKKRRCARKNFAFTIHAEDDTRVAKIILFVNRRRTDTQEVNQQFWNVRVRIPVRKVRAQLPRGARVRVLIGAKAVDTSGKSTKVQRAFRICG